MPTLTRSPRSQLFLVRFWAEGTPPRWRATARNIHTGVENRFATPERLFAFLQDSMIAPGTASAQLPPVS